MSWRGPADRVTAATHASGTLLFGAVPALEFGYRVVVTLLDFSPFLVTACSDIEFGCTDQSILAVVVNERHSLRDNQQSQDDHSCDMETVGNGARSNKRIPPR